MWAHAREAREEGAAAPLLRALQAAVDRSVARQVPAAATRAVARPTRTQT